MEEHAEQTLKELEKENLELKFNAVRKDILTLREENSRDINILREELTKQLTLILEQTSKTNGSVARAMLQISEVEKTNEEHNRKIVELDIHKAGTKFWYTLQTNKWLVIPIILAAYALTLKEIRDLLVALLR